MTSGRGRPSTADLDLQGSCPSAAGRPDSRSGPLIGIVIAAYNAEAFIDQTLQSIREQTIHDWICVVVDDGSTDATPTVVQAQVRSDPRFVLLQQKNEGPCIARNRGFGLLPSGTRFVTFMDGDDVWVPNALEVLLEAVQADALAVGAHGLGDFIDESGRPVSPGAFASLGRQRTGSQGGRPRRWPIDAPTTFETLVVRSTVFPPGLVLVRAAAYREVGLFDPHARYAEDLDLLLRVTRLGHLAFVDKVIIGYRRHDANVGAGHQVARGFATFVGERSIPTRTRRNTEGFCVTAGERRS